MGVFVKPCVNPRCDFRVHPQCIEKVCVENHPVCHCGFPINIVKIEKFETDKCCRAYMKLIIPAVLIIIGYPLLIFLALGGPHIGDWFNCSGSNNRKECDGSVVSLIATIPFLFIYFQIPHLGFSRRGCGKYNIFFCNTLNSRIKHKAYITMGIMYLVSLTLLILVHLIGHPVLESRQGINENFTWRTFFAGYWVFCIIVFSLCGVGAICYFIYYCYLKTNQKFTKSKMQYGMMAHESELVGLHHSVTDYSTMTQK
jgi:hypothetical protein